MGQKTDAWSRQRTKAKDRRKAQNKSRMPRRRGGCGMGGKKRSMFSSPAPAKQSQAPPPAVPQRQGGGFFSTMAQGFALGTGSAIAHEAIRGAVRSFSGGSEQQDQAAPAQQQAAACGAQQKAFLDCMQANNGEMSMCPYYFDAMK